MKGPKGEAEGVMLGVGRGMGSSTTPSSATSPGPPQSDIPPPPSTSTPPTLGPGWKKKAVHIAQPPQPQPEIVCEEHRSFHITSTSFTVIPTISSPLVHSSPLLPTLDESLTPPGSTDSSAASTPELEVWVKPNTLTKQQQSSIPPLLSSSRFRRPKLKVTKSKPPPPIDLIKANSIPTSSESNSPMTSDSNLPTPSSGVTSLTTLKDHFVSDTLRLLRGTLRGSRKGKFSRDTTPWSSSSKHADTVKEQPLSPTLHPGARKKGLIKHGRSLFELRRFYNRSM